MTGRILRLMGALLIAAVAVLQISPAFRVGAAPVLTITPITWNVIGLDSNDVSAGPNNFPVGARVCNTGTTTATNVVSTFVWDSAATYIDLRPGSLSSYSIASLAAGSCTDFYYEVQITRNPLAYNTSRRYHITATADTLSTISTPTPREIFVEHLVSQNRNSVSDVKLDGVSIAAGGTMTLLVGNTYNIELIGSTATNGYEQIESFINFPNTIFRVNSVATTYTANGGTDSQAASKPYANGCGWVNDPTSPNYRSCTGTGKYGGNITVTYNVTIIAGAGTSQTLNTLIYDFSGSSYHYNSDFSSSSRIATIVSLGISKAFSPASIVAGATSTLTFTIPNPTSSTLTGIQFTDTLPTSPAGMTVASPTGATTSGCGAGSFAPVAGATTLSFGSPTAGTIAANGTCTISVNVTVPSSPTSGTYLNTSDHLFMNSTDTGNFATASLGLTTATTGTGICNLTLAQWTMPTSAGTAVPPAYSFKASDVASAAAVAGSGISSTIDTSLGNPVNSWEAIGFSTAATLTTSNNDYFEFSATTTNYTSIGFKFDARLDINLHGPQSLALYSSTDGTTFTSYGSTISPTSSFVNYNPAFTGTANTGGLTYFRIYGYNAGNNGADAHLYIDNITITGCATALMPTILKAFSPNPIAVGGTSTLTFTLTNPNAVQLTGVKFSDSLPAGLQVAATPAAATTCGGSPTWAPAAGATTLDFGQITGATIPAPAGSFCTVSVNITATTAGPHANVSGFISSTESGTNTGSTGFATATLTALLPPVIVKYFDPASILASATSTLTFLISNPNSSDSLTGVGFSDTYPALLKNSSTPNTSTTCSGGTVTAAASGSSISLNNNATIPAAGSCTVTVDVTSASAGDYLNSVTVTSANAGTGNTDSDTLTVTAPNPGIHLLKQISTSASGPWSSFITLDPSVTTSVYYQFTIENTGDVPLSPVTVTDPTVSAASCAWPASLPVASPSQDPTATCVVGPVATASGDHPNTATAHGTYGGTVYDSNTSSADYLGATPGFSLLKQVGTSAAGPWSSAVSGLPPGSNVYYRFTVINTGGVALTSVNVTDPDVSAAGCVFSDPLAISDATACIVGPITAALVNGTYTNTAVAHGTDSGTIYDTAPSSASYTVTSLPADLTVSKTNNVSGSVTLGTPFTWTLTVANSGTGDATFVSGQTIVSDPLPADATYGSPTAGSFTNITNSGNISCAIASGTLSCAASGAQVVIGASGSFTVSFSTTPTALGTLSNIASVDPLGNVTETSEVNNTGSDTVSVLSASPQLTLTKTGTLNDDDGTPGLSVGDTISYAFSVENTGSVTLSNITLADTIGGVMLSGEPIASLAPGAVDSTTFSGSYTLAQTDIDAGSFANTATATGDCPGPVSGCATDGDDETVSLSGASALQLVKTANPTTYGTLGQLISYSFQVQNTGNVTLYGPFTVSDDRATDESCPATASLAPGASITCTASYAIAQADLNSGSVTNLASASGFDSLGGVVTSNTDSETVTASPSPALTLAKSITAGDPYSTVGASITYSYAVSNSGNVSLAGPVGVTDDQVSVICPAVNTVGNLDANLDPGESVTCSATYVVGQADLNNGSVTNVATAHAAGTDSNQDSQVATASQSPHLTLTKSITAGDPYDSVGDVLTYQFVVENTGNVSLAGPVTVTDDKAADESCPATTTVGNLDSFLDPGEQVTCTASYTVAQPDLDAGSVTNVANGHAGGTDSNQDQQTADATETPLIDVTKALTNVSFVSPTTITLTYLITVANTGNVSLDSLQVTDDLNAAFPAPAGFTVQSVISLDFSVNSGFDGDADINLLDGTDTLAPGASGTISLAVQVQTGGDGQSYTNTANGSGTSPASVTVQDSGSASGPDFTDPALTKAVNVSQAQVGDQVIFTITVTNNGSLPAPNVVVTDPLPANLDYISASSAPRGTVTLIPPRTVQVDLSAQDLGVNEVITITIVTQVNGLGQPPTQNTASLTTSDPSDLPQNDAFVVALQITGATSPSALPSTGFAPGVLTRLPRQDPEMAYSGLDGIVLEIPRLGIQTTIVGVSPIKGIWDVTWLGSQAGWLQGTAFPSRSGNSVLTGHVYLADGSPGPFVNLSQLRWGDKIIIHAFGYRYTYEVRQNLKVQPADTSVLKHQVDPWLTLLTCQGYQEASNTYDHRVAVQAALVKVQEEVPSMRGGR